MIYFNPATQENNCKGGNRPAEFVVQQDGLLVFPICRSSTAMRFFPAQYE